MPLGGWLNEVKSALKFKLNEASTNKTTTTRPTTSPGRLAINPPIFLDVVGFSAATIQALLGQKTFSPIIANRAGTKVKAATIMTITQITKPGASEEKIPNLAKNSAAKDVKTTKAADKIASPARLNAKDTADLV